MTKKEANDKGFKSLKYIGKEIGKSNVDKRYIPEDIIKNACYVGKCLYFSPDDADKIKDFLKMDKNKRFFIKNNIVGYKTKADIERKMGIFFKIPDSILKDFKIVNGIKYYSPKCVEKILFFVNDFKSLSDVLKEKGYYSYFNNIPKNLLIGGLTKGNGIAYSSKTIENILKWCKKYSDIDKVDKYKKTCMERYGVDNVSKTDSIKKKIVDSNKKTCMERYGVDSILKYEPVKDKIKKTCMERYGYTTFLLTPKIKEKALKARSKNRSKKYLYDSLYFDSYWEVCYYFYLKNNNIEFTYQPNQFFEYTYNGKIHKYFPDFKVYDRIVELKGDQFFNEDKLINPFDRNMDDFYNEKLKCMIANNVLILKKKDMIPFLKYAKKYNLKSLTIKK